MDRSLDSIGSCSLDVDADSSDISDTSGSLNFPTPLSVKDITREFTANIRERCTVHTVHRNTTAFVDPTSGQVCMVLTEPNSGAAIDGIQPTHAQQQTLGTNATTTGVLLDVETTAYDKKPSYLNLACCVNGYSNLTTYDSKIRQDINKSREVSPIRPSTSSLQYCKKNNSLAAPVLLTMSNVGLNTVPAKSAAPLTKQPASGAVGKYKLLEPNNNNHHQDNGVGNDLLNGTNDVRRNANSSTSFIQQRVERLYGPGALAQGFYSPKKYASPRSKQQLEVEGQQTSTELSRKFKQLSPSKDYSEFRKKLDHNTSTTALIRQVNDDDSLVSNGDDVELPVFRHLSQEFRAQLPTVSPKRSATRVSPTKEIHAVNGNGHKTDAKGSDVVDHKATPEAAIIDQQYELSSKLLTNGPASGLDDANVQCNASGDRTIKDGNHFLLILKKEQARLLALAAVAEKYIDALSNNPEINEDTFGLLRSASGKARLLVTQKMKQFEGLCHNNLNRSPEDKFPTTVDDLQGFWDMVNLQVEHVDSIFADIEKLKSNNWKRINEPTPAAGPISKSQKTLKTGNLKPKATSAAVKSSSNDAAKSAALLKREAQRKQLMEMKRKHREAMTAANSATSGQTNTEDGNLNTSSFVAEDGLSSDKLIIAVEKTS